MNTKTDIRELSFEEIQAFCKTENLPNYRAKQIWQWVWNKRATSIEDMTSLPKEVKHILSQHFQINPISIHKTETSTDGTIKYSMQLHDGLLIESVIIPSRDRLTACVSSQVGCSLACEFCATGTIKLKRNLTAAEIYDQVFILNTEAQLHYQKPLSNIVYMGMGEPMLNYKAVINSIHFVTSEDGLGMSAKRITVSTAGIPKMIRKLADDNIMFNLAISLHSAIDEKRNQLMPINQKANLTELRDAIRYFYDKTKSRITYEYILFKDLNDTEEDAKKLVQFAKVSPCKINLIEYNPIDLVAYQKSLTSTTEAFIAYLKKNHLIVNLRKSKGKDIAAACGQLVNKLQ